MSEYVRALKRGTMNNLHAPAGDRHIGFDRGDLIPDDHWSVRQASDPTWFSAPVDLGSAEAELAADHWRTGRELAAVEERNSGALETWPAGQQERFGNLTRRQERTREALHGHQVDHIRSLAAGGATESGTPFTAGGTPRRGDPLQGAQTLARGQKITDWLRTNHPHTHDRGGGDLSFDRYLRGIVTADWRGADEERALSVGTATAGGHLVPSPLAATVIDLARAKMRVAEAGATFVPMTTSTLKVPRLTGEGAPAWRNENATITAGDLTFDAVTFTARSLDRLVIMSRELFEDSDPSASTVIAHSFAAQLALELDRAALRGTGSAPEPRGMLNQSGITATAHGANGTVITNYDWWLDAVGAVRANNFEPTAHIQAPRTSTSLAKLKEATTNAYMSPPPSMLPMLTTKQVPINLTVGTSTDASEIYTGQWNQLAIGIRVGFRLQPLLERYADSGQIGFIANLRADVQVFQPTAFVVDTGVRT
ncbi:phage major capsid protein [Streptomyces sp. NPDC005808]|uniref:phage major capsid protein n=1 Tax=Streptomyces sp. NPDC005808 TaxID=3364734 RepID=UPI0036BCAA3E